MPYADLTVRRACAKRCSRNHYLAHKAEVIARASIWRKENPEKNRLSARKCYHNAHPEASYSKKYAPIPSLVPIPAILSVQTTIQSPKTTETPLERNRRRATDYHHRNKVAIRAKYFANKTEKILPVVVVDTNYVSSKLQNYINLWGEIDGRWFNRIRIDICEGKGTPILSSKENEKWFGMLNSIIRDKIGASNLEKASRGNYTCGIFTA